jgi:hypothetical protein
MGKTESLGIPYYLLNPFTNVYFVAAEGDYERQLADAIVCAAVH